MGEVLHMFGFRQRMKLKYRMEFDALLNTAQRLEMQGLHEFKDNVLKRAKGVRLKLLHYEFSARPLVSMVDGKAVTFPDATVLEYAQRKKA